MDPGHQQERHRSVSLWISYRPSDDHKGRRQLTMPAPCPDVNVCIRTPPKALRRHSELTQGKGRNTDWLGFNLSLPGSDSSSCHQAEWRSRACFFFFSPEELKNYFAHLHFYQRNVQWTIHMQKKVVGWSVQTTVGRRASKGTSDPFQKLGLSSKSFDWPTSGWPAPSTQTHQTDE